MLPLLFSVPTRLPDALYTVPFAATLYVLEPIRKEVRELDVENGDRDHSSGKESDSA